MDTVTVEKEALESLKKAVHDLGATVADYRKDAIDRETLEATVQEMLVKQKELDEAQGARRGLKPTDTEIDALAHIAGDDVPAKLAALHATRADVVAHVVKGVSKEAITNLQVQGDRLLLISAILGKKIEDPRETRFYNEVYKPTLEAAVNTQNAGQGAEWIPRELSPNLIDRVELTLKVLSLFQTVPMPTQPYDLPGRAVSRTKLAKGVENTADTGQTLVKKIQIASRKVTFSAKKFWGEALVSKDAEEDAIIAQLPLIESELRRFMAYDMEDTSVNGDTAGTMDTGWAADDPRLNWDGLRKRVLAAAKYDGSSINSGKTAVAHLRKNRKNMGKYGVDPLELAHILSINSYIDLLDDTSLLTLEKYGPNATVLTGELGKVDNVPVIVSEAARTDLNATGVFDNVTTTKTSALTVYTPGFGVGERRGLTVEILRELYSEADQDAVKVSVRRAFEALQPTATEKTIAAAYNLST